MTATAHLTRHHDVGLIELDNPPVNALSLGVRQGLGEQLAAALADPTLVAIVLAGAGRRFCGGADLREFNTPASSQPPNSRDLRVLMERSTKPIVAASSTRSCPTWACSTYIRFETACRIPQISRLG
jgi:3-hydroxyacyl-CoA dehydrogenase